MAQLNQGKRSSLGYYPSQPSKMQAGTHVKPASAAMQFPIDRSKINSPRGQVSQPNAPAQTKATNLESPDLRHGEYNSESHKKKSVQRHRRGVRGSDPGALSES